MHYLRFFRKPCPNGLKLRTIFTIKQFIDQCHHTKIRTNNNSIDCWNTGGVFSCRSHNVFRRESCSVSGCRANVLAVNDRLDNLGEHISGCHNELLSLGITELDGLGRLAPTKFELEKITCDGKLKIEHLTVRWRQRHSSESLRSNSIMDLVPALEMGFKQSIVKDRAASPNIGGLLCLNYYVGYKHSSWVLLMLIVPKTIVQLGI